MATEHPPRDRQIDVQIDRLIDEDAGQHPRDEIKRLAHDSASELQEATVQQFVPNLVHNDVKGHLVHDNAVRSDDDL